VTFSDSQAANLSDAKRQKPLSLISGPFCGPLCVHSGPLAPLRAADKNPETRTIKQNQLTSLNENGCPGDSRRLHHFFILTSEKLIVYHLP